MLYRLQCPSWYQASVPAGISMNYFTLNKLLSCNVCAPSFKVSLHFQIYFKYPPLFFSWSDWQYVVFSNLISSVVHNRGRFLGAGSTFPFFFSFLTSSPTPLPTTSLHPPWVESQSWALSALRLVFRPHCALVTWHPDSISNGVFCVSRLQKTLWPPPPAAVSDHVTQSWAADLLPTLLLQVAVYCREGASSFLPVPDWEIDRMNRSMMNPWWEWGKLWSDDEVAETNNMLLWCNRNNFIAVRSEELRLQKMWKPHFALCWQQKWHIL